MVLDLLKRRLISAMTRIAADTARGETAPLREALAQVDARMAQFAARVDEAAVAAAHDATVNRTLTMVRAEYTVMPRFAFHQPLNHLEDTLPPRFAPSVHIEGEPLPLPPPDLRGGYPVDDAEYLDSGRNHQQVYLDEIRKHHGLRPDLTVMELGCATGRVLRHFHTQKEELGWKLIGCDLQASHIEWLRQNWPLDINVYVGSAFPKLPFEDNSLDVIYGMSVFTHIKYHWDFWLLELRRVLKPGGLLLQTIHAERAWRFYHDHQHLDWVRAAISPRVLESAEMNHDFLLCGDVAVSQTFFRQEVARRYWGRYLEVLDVLSPDDRYWFQDLLVCRK